MPIVRLVAATMRVRVGVGGGMIVMVVVVVVVWEERERGPIGSFVGDVGVGGSEV